ncbi:MAG: hypothetical protein WA908_06735 [Pontixanthobacter sp.]
MKSANDMKAANKTYDAFIANLKWSVPVICVITAIVVILIS